MSATIELQSTPAPKLADVVKDAAQNGEILVTEEGKLVARIVAVRSMPPARRKRQFGSAKGRITVPDDFKAPLEVLKDYM